MSDIRRCEKVAHHNPCWLLFLLPWLFNVHTVYFQFYTYLVLHFRLHIRFTFLSMIFATIGIWRFLTFTTEFVNCGTPIHRVGRVIWHGRTKYGSWYVPTLFVLLPYLSPIFLLIMICINVHFELNSDALAWHCPCGWNCCCVPNNLLIHNFQYLLCSSPESTQWLRLWLVGMHVHGWQLSNTGSDEVGMLYKIMW